MIVVEQRDANVTLDTTTVLLGTLADAVIVIAYVISVALYLRIMAQYLVRFVDSAGSALWEPVIACLAVAMIVGIGAVRGFTGLDKLDRVSLAAVLVLTTVLGGVLPFHDVTAAATSGSVRLPPIPSTRPLTALLILGGIVITVQGFETVRYLADEYDAPTRVWASRLAQLITRDGRGRRAPAGSPGTSDTATRRNVRTRHRHGPAGDAAARSDAGRAPRRR